MTDDIMTMTETLEIDEDLEVEEESTRPESVEDSARLALEDLASENDETDEPEHGAEAKESKESTVNASEAARILAKSKKPKKRQVIDAAQLQTGANKEAASDTPLDPPARFPVEAKEQFHKLPKVVQQQALEFWNGLEGNMTKKLQEASRYAQKYQHIDQLMGHYIDDIHSSGFTDSQFLAEMFATWRNLKNNPVSTVQKIIQNLGITPEQLSGQQQAPQVQQHIQSNALTAEQVERILEQREQRNLQQASLNAAVNEVAALRNERDPQQGTYLYPELWDDSFLQRVQPLVKYHRETHPGISIAEATKRAVLTHRSQMAAAGSPSPMNTRLTPQDEIQRVKAASVSVRPRGNGTIPTLSQAKKGESVRESTEAILAAFNRH